MRFHTRTPRNTTLHHPSTHSDNDTDPRHIKSLHFRTHLISLATVCFIFCHRRADFERISCSERAPKRRSCRLKRRSFLRERRRPTRLQRCPARSTCKWKVVIIRTLELFTLSRTFSRFAEEMLARLALGSGRRISSTSLASATRKSSELTLWLQVAVFTHLSWKTGRRDNATLLFFIHHAKRMGWRCYVGPFLSHFSRHVTRRSGLPLHGKCSPRCCVARSLARFVAKRLHFVGGVERDSRCIGFAILSSLSPFHQMCHLIPWLTLATNHLTRRRPTHAQNFTIRSHSTAQVPCSCLASTCSDVDAHGRTHEFHQLNHQLGKTDASWHLHGFFVFRAGEMVK